MLIDQQGHQEPFLHQPDISGDLELPGDSSPHFQGMCFIEYCACHPKCVLPPFTLSPQPRTACTDIETPSEQQRNEGWSDWRVMVLHIKVCSHHPIPTRS